MAKSKKISVGRRGFLKRAAAGAAAALAVKPGVAGAQAPVEAARPAAPPASARQVPLEAAPPPRADVSTTARPGADFRVDVLKSLNFDYIFANPGSIFRGLQESFVNYGKNTKPERITCCHEES